MLKRFLQRARKAVEPPRASSARRRPLCEPLETRQMLSTASNDFVLSGFTWPDPKRITYSFPADGIPWDGGTNNLNATLDAEYGGNGWKALFAKALQTWAASADIDVVPVPDSNAPFNAGGLPQGDPGFGDIRIGGYNFNDNTLLAQTYYPPPNGATAAGDVEINTGFSWGPGATYDLFSVLLHETGHSFGLAEAPAGSTSVMAQDYGGVRPGLTAGDVAGVRSMYGARPADAYQANGGATSPASAYDLTSRIAPIAVGTDQVTLADTSLVTIGDAEYFTFVAPAGVNESMVVAASSIGVSSLSPKLSVYDATMQLISPYATNDFPGQWSNFVPVEVGLVQPGQRYYVAVTGATGDAFAIGAYDFQVTFQGVTAPTTTTLPAPALSQPSAPGQAIPRSYDLETVQAADFKGQSLSTMWNVDVYSFIAAKTGTVVLTTGTTRIQIVDQSGQITAIAIGQVEFTATAGRRYWAFISTSNGLPTPSYDLSISILTAPSDQRIAAPATTVKPKAKPSATDRSLAAVDAATPRVALKTTQRPHQRVETVNPRWAR